MPKSRCRQTDSRRSRLPPGHVEPTAQGRFQPTFAPALSPGWRTAGRGPAAPVILVAERQNRRLSPATTVRRRLRDIGGSRSGRAATVRLGHPILRLPCPIIATTVRFSPTIRRDTARPFGHTNRILHVPAHP